MLYRILLLSLFAFFSTSTALPPCCYAQDDPAPQPRELPPASDTVEADKDFISTAVEAVELLANYDSASAEPRFRRLQNLMIGPGKDALMDSLRQGELPIIQSTRRVQKFVLDDQKIDVEHFPDLDDVVIRLTGKRTQWIELKPLPAEELTYHVNLQAETAAPGRKTKIMVKDIKVRPAAEAFSFPGHISNKTIWMNEYAQKTTELQSTIESRNADLRDLVSKLSAQVEKLAKRLKETEEQLRVVGMRLEKMEKEIKDSRRKQLSATLREKMALPAEDPLYADGENP